VSRARGVAYADLLAELLGALVRGDLGLAPLPRVGGEGVRVRLAVRHDLVRVEHGQKRVEGRVRALEGGLAGLGPAKAAPRLGLAEHPADGHEDELLVADLVEALVVAEHAERAEHAPDEVEVVDAALELGLGGLLERGEGAVEDREEVAECAGVELWEREVCVCHGEVVEREKRLKLMLLTEIVAARGNVPEVASSRLRGLRASVLAGVYYP
jgi:hypothetical protein